MCGIVGFLGREKAKPLLLEGLKRLEYRGYDSVGFDLYDSTREDFLVRRCVGTVDVLVQRSLQDGNNEDHGIAHTRWATH